MHAPVRTLAAVLFAGCTLIAAGFQLALLLGVPWGEYTLSGRWPGVLPPAVRLIPLASIVVLIGMAVIVVARAGLAFAALRPMADRWIRVVVGYGVVGAVANALSPSPRERALWLPVVLGMLALSLIVARSAPTHPKG